MSLNVEYNNETGIVESILSNSISLEELYMMTYQSLALAKKHNSTKLLCDASNSINDIFIKHALELENVYEEEGLSKNVKIAVVEPIENKSKKFVSFYETACINKGWNAKVFPNRQLALEWLLESTPIESQE